MVVLREDLDLMPPPFGLGLERSHSANKPGAGLRRPGGGGGPIGAGTLPVVLACRGVVLTTVPHSTWHRMARNLQRVSLPLTLANDWRPPKGFEA